MSNKLIAGFCGTIALVAGLAASASPAYAGFQWIAPTDGAAYQPSVTVSSAPPSVATSVPETISPVVITGDTHPSTPAPSNVAGTSSANDKLSLATATISVSAASSSGGMVQGFASQIPLALALRQILPIGYSFSIDQDVGMDTLVSYKGGKPWHETLDEMLASAGLAGHVQGTMLTVSRASAPAAVADTDKGAAALTPISEAPALHPTAISTPEPRAAMPSFNVSSADGWSADRGETLRKVLTEWCRRSNVELQWLAEYDYPIGASVHFNGGFEEAVRGLLAGFDEARPQPIGELHTNSSAGQRVLVVQARGNNYTN